MNSRCRAISEMSDNVTQSELNKWKVVIQSTYPKELQQQIDCKGEINGKVTEELPTLDSLAKQILTGSLQLLNQFSRKKVAEIQLSSFVLFP